MLRRSVLGLVVTITSKNVTWRDEKEKEVRVRQRQEQSKDRAGQCTYGSSWIELACVQLLEDADILKP